MKTPQELSRVDEIISKKKEILNSSTDRSINKLKPFTTIQPDPEEIFACFELFHSQDYGMGYNKFFPKKPGGFNSLDTRWGPMDETGESFLPELRDFEEELFSNTELTDAEWGDWAKKSEDLLIEWFSSCWQQAGGRNSTVPTYFCLEKEYRCRDMFTGEVISEEEAARRAGYTAE